jgi:hypothetical protein
MVEKIEYELTGSHDNDLSITVPHTIITRAAERTSDLPEEIKKLGLLKLFTADMFDPSKTRFTLDFNRLGEFDTVRGQDKVKALSRVMGFLITAPTAEEADERLRFKAFNLGHPWSDFYINASVELPNVSQLSVEQLVAQKMESARQPFKSVGSRVDVDIDPKKWVDLSLSGHSSVHTLGGHYQPGAKRIELSSNNVEQFGEPLVYLMGIVALAHADEYIKE